MNVSKSVAVSNCNILQYCEIFLKNFFYRIPQVLLYIIRIVFVISEAAIYIFFFRITILKKFPLFLDTCDWPVLVKF